MLLVLRKIHKIFAIVGQVDFFRAPEKGQLLFDQVFKDLMLLLVVTCNVDGLAEKHRLLKSIKLVTVKSCVSHSLF